MFLGESKLESEDPKMPMKAGIGKGFTLSSAL